MASKMSYISVLALASLVRPAAAWHYNPYLVAHASTGSVAWVFLIPLGAILFTRSRYPESHSTEHPAIRKTRSSIFWIHTIIQTLGIILAITNFGLGTYIAAKYHKELANPHTILGTIIFILMFVQPMLGFVHHLRFKSLSRSSKLPSPAPCDKKISSSWTTSGLVHRWLGRAIIVLAMINGGLGFQLAEKVPKIYSRKGEIAYAVMASVMFVIWMSVVFVGYRKRQQRAAKAGALRDRMGSRDPVLNTGSDVRGSSDHGDQEKEAGIVQ